MTLEAAEFTRRGLLKRTGALTVLTASGSLLSACGGDDAKPGESTLAAARRVGRMRVGFANEAPYGFANEAGELTGEAPEVARAVLKELGIKELEGVLTKFESLIPGLNARRFDIIAAGMFITPERCEQILFSDPDYVAPEAFAVKKGNPLGLQDYGSVADNAEVRLGVLAGAVEGDQAKAAGVGDSQVTRLPDPQSAIEGLRTGRIDALALTSISIRRLIETSGRGEVELAGPFVPVVDGKEQLGGGGYGFRKADKELRDAFNQKLDAMKQADALLPIVEPFGFTAEELKPAKQITAADLCKAA